MKALQGRTSMLVERLTRSTRRRVEPIRWFVALAALSALSAPAHSEQGKGSRTPRHVSGSGITLQKSVIGNGGALTSGPNHSIRGTVGQPAARLLSSVPPPGHMVCSGFWCVPIPGLVDTPLPERPAQIDFGLPHPNPVNGAMQLPFALPNEARVDIELIDVTGRRVRTLAADRFEAGRHSVSWDGRDTEGFRVAAGVYFMRIQMDGREAGRRRVVVVR